MARRIVKLAIITAALPMLGGCVAALVPLAASSAFLGNEALDNDENAEAVAIREAAQEAEAGNVELAAAQPPAPEPLVQAPAAQPVSEPEPVELAAIDTNGADTSTLIGPVDSEPSPVSIEPPATEASETVAIGEAADPPAAIAETQPSGEPVTMAPVPDASANVAPPLDTPVVQPSAPTVPFGPTNFRAYDVLYNYVDLQSRRDPVDNPRQSAVLAAPGTLSPMRTDCSIRPPAVLVDLDPGEGVFDPAITPAPNPALSQMLASLRLQEVEVFWISEIAAVKAGEVRKALMQSGMDTQGRDQLLLMRRVGDRKQTRRRELSETHCLLAIAGDQRSDFDELYLYLRDPAAAQPLEELIGAGWFLTPPPLDPQTSTANIQTER